ncbi:DUF484 family protein [Pseudoroseicyclus aestuarii]|uniref:DUF484 family protein n=1 Tax=Pseudoroseicyclus aestuarii TaxID=1795041 RepID=A0A318SPR1_9RHOB|nr:DUF484 family protein [Pseudoroseicyclus aestuarii]PYE83860.1 hypothetical protein DFP88_103221 [Pseudoroseicyclus aestuarii]
MSSSTDPSIDPSIRDRIIADPGALLDDQDIMRALVNASDASKGSNVVDLRGAAMTRLEARLDRLEDTHRSVIAAAYDNLAGTNQIHRAVLKLLDPEDFPAFLANLRGDLAGILNVDAARLVLETAHPEDPAAARLDPAMCMKPAGFVAAYLPQGRQVTLRRVSDGALYEASAQTVQSEACLRLDLGHGRLPGMLALGAADAERFSPQHGTDLLGFFADTFERAMRRWLA